MPKKSINGLLVTIFSDEGPIPVFNTSTLNEVVALKLSVVGMTILSLGYGGDGVYEKRHYRLHGPIPVPDTADLEAIAMSFKVSTDNTIDTRVDHYGRESTLFIIFFSSYRKEIIAMHDKIEITLKEFLTTITTESDIDRPEFISSISDTINQLFEKEIIPIPNDQQKVISIPNDQQKVVIQQNNGFRLYLVNSEGILTLLDEYNQIQTADILVFVNTLTKTIFNLSIKQNVSQQKRFLAAKAISQLNMNQYKSEYQVRTITDDFEVNFYLEKIENIYNQYRLT